MLVPADNDARSVYDDDAGLQLFEQPEVFNCQALIHKLPLGARRISNACWGYRSQAPIVAVGGLLSAAV
jgi:hypothetical protein